MGRAGIRRRKPYQRLPRAEGATENDVVPPHVMWPSRSAGFEASPYSTAGTHQRSWWLLNGLARGGRKRRGRVARGLVPREIVVLTAWAVLLSIVAVLGFAALQAVSS